MSKTSSTKPRSAQPSSAQTKSPRSRSGTQPPVEPKRCLRCGAKAVKPRLGPGRTTRYRTMPTLAIPEDVAIPACGRCQSEYLDEESALAIQPRLQTAYLLALHVRTRLAIDVLSQHISQRRLEQLLGLSQGYLSRIRAGAGNPSPELVSHLALLAQDPK
ncbi:MAG TPA: helix-turn-helix transcriptional regulator, partial [Pseudomonadota bacterium]|nr:helix-turn-helix transcriptional regulator [Pseudomonadota bacterium]